MSTGPFKDFRNLIKTFIRGNFPRVRRITMSVGAWTRMGVGGPNSTPFQRWPCLSVCGFAMQRSEMKLGGLPIFGPSAVFISATLETTETRNCLFSLVGTICQNAAANSVRNLV
jgi:hypothetical protein